MSRATDRRDLENLASEYAITDRQRQSIIQMFFSSLSASTVAQTVAELYSSGRHDELLKLEIDPTTYDATQAHVFADDYQAVKFLSKYVGLKTSGDKREKALKKFFEMENHCRMTNHRFRSYVELENSAHALSLFVMRRKIDLILGDFEIEEFYDNCAWGPGTTALIKGDDTSPTRKFQSEIGISQSAFDLFGSSLAVAYPTWFREEQLADSSVQFVNLDVVTTVPKDAKIDRVIRVGPGIDLWLQRGAGKVIKKRLRRFGIDLSDQTRNQALARESSVSGLNCTVDHSSASDSIAWAVVHKQFPVTWFTVLNALRTKSGKVDEVVYNWEGFSSMGNGFTFELESLIFFAAALAVAEVSGVPAHDISVYGDDLVIPSAMYHSYVEFAEFLGFKINREKSFSSGHFRESCGAHYFNGLDVKPVFLRKEISDASSLFKLANSVRSYSHRRNLGCGCDRRFLDTWRHISRRLPPAFRSMRIPAGYGDVGLASNFDEACPHLAGDGWESYSVQSLQIRTVTKSQSCHGLLVARLCDIGGSTLPSKSRSYVHGRVYAHWLREEALEMHRLKLQDVEHGNETGLRDRTTFAVRQMVVHSWYDFGPWE